MSSSTDSSSSSSSTQSSSSDSYASFTFSSWDGDVPSNAVVLSKTEAANFRASGRVVVEAPWESHGVAVFYHKGRVYAIGNKCAHGKGKLVKGDIEELDEWDACSTSSPPPSALCVRCPKHRRKFGDGLYFSLETGDSYVPEKTRKYKSKYRVGACKVVRRGDDVVVFPSPDDSGSSGSEDTSSGDEETHEQWELVDRIPDARDSYIFTFRRSDADTANLQRHRSRRRALASAIANAGELWHVTLSATIGGQVVERDYTPVSSMDDLRAGEMRILIKIYADGVFTQHLDGLSEGSLVAVSDPAPTLSLTELFPRRHRPRLGLVVGGTGIAPAVQLMRVLASGTWSDKARVQVINCNHTRDDVLYSVQLDRLAARSGAVTIHHLLTQEEGRGRVTTEELQRWLPSPRHRGTHIVVCGPPTMWDTVSAQLAQIGYASEQLTELES